MTKLLPQKSVLLAVAILTQFLLVPSAFSATILWTGNANDGVFETGGNWNTGNPPTNTDWQDTAKFDTGTPGTVTLSASRNIFGLEFATAGWTISGSNFGELTAISSSGVGTNTIGNTFQLHANRTWTLGVGNILSFNSTFYQKNMNLTLNGGGTLSLGSQVGGFSSGDWGIHLQNATLEMRNNSVVHTSGSAGVVYIDSLSAALILKSSVVAAEGLIGNRVRDGLGGGLVVTQIDADYVSITAVPEPGVGVFGLVVSALGVTLVGRRRKSLP